MELKCVQLPWNIRLTDAADEQKLEKKRKAAIRAAGKYWLLHPINAVRRKTVEGDRP